MPTETNTTVIVEIPFTISGLHGAMIDLAQQDHSVPYIHHKEDPTPDQNLRILNDAIDFLRNQQAEMSDPKDHRDLLLTVEDLQDSIQGYNFRKENKLPGIRQQFLAARKAMVNGQNYGELLTQLANQKDATSTLQQLQREYELYEEVLGQGGELDIDQLNTNVWNMFQGLSVMPPWELDTRLTLIDDLEIKVSGSSVLAHAQGRGSKLDDMLASLKAAKTRGLMSYADALKTPITRLSLENKISIPKELQRQHQDRIQELEESKNPRGKFREVLNYLCQVTELDATKILEQPISLIGLEEDLVKIDAEMAALRFSEGVESFLDDIPIIGPIRQKSKQKIRSQIESLLKLKALASNRVELASSINKAREFVLESKA